MVNRLRTRQNGPGHSPTFDPSVGSQDDTSGGPGTSVATIVRES